MKMKILMMTMKTRRMTKTKTRRTTKTNTRRMTKTLRMMTTMTANGILQEDLSSHFLRLTLKKPTSALNADHRPHRQRHHRRQHRRLLLFLLFSETPYTYIGCIMEFCRKISPPTLGSLCGTNQHPSRCLL